MPSSGVIAEASLLGATVPLAGIAGDQQAALFGQGCFMPGDVKATYGTGTFVLANVGALAGPVAPGLLKTAAATPAGATAQYAAEGSVLVGGAALQWLRDGLGLIGDAAESEQLAREAGSTGGVVFVPALAGLGSPHWDAEARGLITGITRGTTRAQIVRAALEGMAHQVADIVDVLPVAAGVLRADGGATANGFLMQLQADLIGVPVEVSADADATALGAAALAGLAVGIWPDVARRSSPLLRRGARYEPSLESGDDRAGSRGLAARSPPGDAAGDVGHRPPWRLERGEGEHAACLRAGDRARRGLCRVRHPGLERRRPRRLPRSPARPAHRSARAAARAPLAELRELGIPTLAEVLELTAGRIGVMAELKSPWLYRRHDIVAPNGRTSFLPTASSSRSRAARSSRPGGSGPPCGPSSTSATAPRSGPPPGSPGRRATTRRA